jgi:hypothetical protein
MPQMSEIYFCIGAIDRKVFFYRGSCPRGNCPRGNCPGFRKTASHSRYLGIHCHLTNPGRLDPVHLGPGRLSPIPLGTGRLGPNSNVELLGPGSLGPYSKVGLLGPGRRLGSNSKVKRLGLGQLGPQRSETIEGLV